ncbi:hypothetical protein SCLCIDRAFT_32667 [Scleroderma citrinum Foug A]|uniref:Uncharacterized protein n=1 Tax=Scleroderma citrinum Foug A TaxID=1036808 RepID=A0A0C3D8C3_9AGAM|nr:hypothetical protein SCLCIDRAFT_32667 [Scleroderma citrinum Foug A]
MAPPRHVRLGVPPDPFEVLEAYEDDRFADGVDLGLDEANADAGQCPQERKVSYHPILDGTPCDHTGRYLPPGTPPPPKPSPLPEDYSPFESRATFELAEFLYKCKQMSATKIDKLLAIMASIHKKDPLFHSHTEMYSMIDATTHGDSPWKSFSVKYLGAMPDDPPPWMSAEYDMWYCDPKIMLKHQLANPDFKGKINYATKVMIDEHGHCKVCDLMSGQWAFKQSDIIAQDADMHGAMFMPVVLGSTRLWCRLRRVTQSTTPSMSHLGTSTIMSIGLTMMQYQSSCFLPFLRLTKRTKTMLYSTISVTNYSTAQLQPYGHFRCMVYGLGPYIVDYPEQVLLACVVQGWCPWCTSQNNNLDGGSGCCSHELSGALTDVLDPHTLSNNYGIVNDIMPFTSDFPHTDIHELIAPDLLYQLIKGTFKDHLIT